MELERQIRPSVVGGRRRRASPPSQSTTGPAEAFEGDFFGTDYDDNDFPFPADKHDLRVPTVHDSFEENDPDSEEELGEDLQNPGWEPPRDPPTMPQSPSQQPSESLNDQMDIDTGPARAPGGASTEAHDRLRQPPAHIEYFGGMAGAPILSDNNASGYTQYTTTLGDESNLWAPFASQMDWEIARWAKLRGSGSTAFSDLLNIEGLVEALGLSYQTSNELNKIIDTKIPARRPAFKHFEANVAGEAFDIFARDILECIRALYGDPEHAQYLCIAPERHYADADKTLRLYHELNTGRWWWSTQKVLEQTRPGATIIPIIISSDKTQITLFRNKSAYPVYLTIGNLPKSIRRKPSRQGQILLAYLPTSRLLHISVKAARRRTLANLFHACMSRILQPLKDAGIYGIEMMSGDGIWRRCHPILAVYIGDYPEQCLVTGAYTGDCPGCDCAHDELGEYPCEAFIRDMDAVFAALDQLGSPNYTEACRKANIKPLQHPFWEDLPYVDIFLSITPDILHQLHQGVIKHLIGWLTEACGAAEIDARVRRLPPNHSIRIFHKGITTLSRVSGTEHRQMSSFLLGLLADIHLPVSSARLIRATRALLDFLYLAQYPVHTDETLDALEASLCDFHANKSIFVDLGIREGFNIPKLHSLTHYVRAIKVFGTTDNYNTEATERLHIDFAKDAYQATNHKDEFPQMTKWLERREKILHHTNYVIWRTQRRGDGPVPISAHCETRWRPSDLSCALHHKMTRHPTRKSVSLSEIMYMYGATFFPAALARFVVQFNHPTRTRRQIEEDAADIHIPFSTLPVFHRIKFWNEEFHGNTTLDSLHVYPQKVDEHGNVIAPARFDTALVRVRSSRDASEHVSQIDGCRVAQVRIIFTLPPASLPLLFPSKIFPPRHLAYVEWFTNFTPYPDPNFKMYKVKRAFADGERIASVVPVSIIQRSVHLLPKWGAAVPPSWTSQTVLDACPSFFVNSFKDSHTHFNVY
ncbi:hypothetical protein D9615_000743 [Tricholomella constricta]|uniref:Uncharacterized protein n=1 Tax=Tricholomella constricta TaxID=117010 RepID=A0A8H5HSF0_9AGAR|nr:hypothetical protein D9615_000743 [Tricholomella constricta]